MENLKKKQEAGKVKGQTPSLSSMGFFLHRAQSRLRDNVTKAIQGSGLQPGHLGILGVLSDCGGMNQRRLGELSRIEKSSMVIFLDALEAKGWIRRERDPRDRRAYTVQLTLDGAKRFANLGPRLWIAEQNFLEPLSSAEVETLTKLLARLGGDPEAGTREP